MSVALAKIESWEDHIEAWHHFGRQAEGALWGRAEVAASVKREYRDNGVQKFADEVRCKKSAIYYLIKTFEAFPELSTRVESLTFSHHRLAAELTANAKEAKAAVEHAAAEGWKTPALRAYLKAPKEETTAAAATESCATEEGACGPVTPKDRMLHLALLIGGFNKVREYELEPLVQLGTKKSLRELSGQIEEIIAWFESFKTAIRRRI